MLHCVPFYPLKSLIPDLLGTLDTTIKDLFLRALSLSTFSFCSFLLYFYSWCVQTFLWTEPLHSYAWMHTGCITTPTVSDLTKEKKEISKFSVILSASLRNGKSASSKNTVPDDNFLIGAFSLSTLEPSCNLMKKSGCWRHVFVLLNVVIYNIRLVMERTIIFYWSPQSTIFNWSWSFD